MSRAFHPPDTLSKDDIRTIADVRREIWTNSFKGLAVGTITGYAFYSVASIGQHKLKLWNLPITLLNRNTAFLSVLLGGAIGSFIMSVTTGKNEVHNLHPIFQIGSRNTTIGEKDDETVSTHLSLKELSILQKSNNERSKNENNNSNTAADVIDRTQLERNRLYRRMTLSKKLEQGGLVTSDASSSSQSVTDHDKDGRLLSDQDIINKSSSTTPR
jgi:hypothetical protein